MGEADRIFESVYERALLDPSVVGLFLSGSRGKGFEAPHSDYDIRVVLAEGVNVEAAARPYEVFKRSQVIEFGFMTLGQLRAYAGFGSDLTWDRYSFAHVEALIDRTGLLQPVIDAKGRLPEEQRLRHVREELDSFINSVYRSFKCHRRGDTLGARLEAVTGVPSLLNVAFGLEGRHAPYLGYLNRELDVYPLEAFPLESEALLQLISEIADSGNVSAQQRLLQTVEPLCKAEGMADIFEAWEDAYPWLLAYGK